MTKEMYELREMLVNELEKLTKKGELTAGSLDTVDKLTHSIKSIDTIVAMEEAGEYSHDGMSYARGRNVRRDSMGRYSSDSRYSMNHPYYDRGYSMHDKRDLINELRDLMNETSDSKSRMAIQNAIQQMEG